MENSLRALQKIVVAACTCSCNDIILICILQKVKSKNRIVVLIYILPTWQHV